MGLVCQMSLLGEGKVNTVLESETAPEILASYTTVVVELTKSSTFVFEGGVGRQRVGNELTCRQIEGSI